MTRGGVRPEGDDVMVGRDMAAVDVGEIALRYQVPLRGLAPQRGTLESVFRRSRDRLTQWCNQTLPGEGLVTLRALGDTWIRSLGP